MKAVYTKPVLVKREPLSRVTAVGPASPPANGAQNAN